MASEAPPRFPAPSLTDIRNIGQSSVIHPYFENVIERGCGILQAGTDSEIHIPVLGVTDPLTNSTNRDIVFVDVVDHHHAFLNTFGKTNRDVAIRSFKALTNVTMCPEMSTHPTHKLFGLHKCACELDPRKNTPHVVTGIFSHSNEAFLVDHAGLVLFHQMEEEMYQRSEDFDQKCHHLLLALMVAGPKNDELVRVLVQERRLAMKGDGVIVDFAGSIFSLARKQAQDPLFNMQIEQHYVDRLRGSTKDMFDQNKKLVAENSVYKTVRAFSV